MCVFIFLSNERKVLCRKARRHENAEKQTVDGTDFDGNDDMKL